MPLMDIQARPQNTPHCYVKDDFLGTRSGHQIFTHKPVDRTVLLFAYRDIITSNWVVNEL